MSWNWYQNKVDEETKRADSRDKVKHNERSNRYFFRPVLCTEPLCTDCAQSRTPMQLCTKSVQSRFIALNVHQMAPFV